MALIMPAVNADDVAKNPTAFRFVPGTGYQMLGTPPVPDQPVNGDSACFPTVPAPKDSWHRLQPPNGNTFIRMQWDPDTRNWTPPLGSGGRRVAFSAGYLAGHGWTYLEAE